MKIHDFNGMMMEHLGECGAYAVLDAINYYLMHNKEFPCEEDKLILLGILFDSPYASGYYPQYSALHNFSISMNEVHSHE